MGPNLTPGRGLGLKLTQVKNTTLALNRAPPPPPPLEKHLCGGSFTTGPPQL